VVIFHAIVSCHLRRSFLRSPSTAGLAPKSLSLTSLAAPHPLTPAESHPYENQRGQCCNRLLRAAWRAFAFQLLPRSLLTLFALWAKSVSQFLSNQMHPQKCRVSPINSPSGTRPRLPWHSHAAALSSPVCLDFVGASACSYPASVRSHQPLFTRARSQFSLAPCFVTSLLH
jgi:hypothetical protein